MTKLGLRISAFALYIALRHREMMVRFGGRFLPELGAGLLSSPIFFADIPDNWPDNWDESLFFEQTCACD